MVDGQRRPRNTIRNCGAFFRFRAFRSQLLESLQSVFVCTGSQSTTQKSTISAALVLHSRMPFVLFVFHSKFVRLPCDQSHIRTVQWPFFARYPYNTGHADSIRNVMNRSALSPKYVHTICSHLRNGAILYGFFVFALVRTFSTHEASQRLCPIHRFANVIVRAK